MPNKAVFFDRDGIVNYRIVGEYVDNYSKFIFIPDFLPFFKFVKENDYLAFVITNQQGVGKGLMTESDLSYIHSLMQNNLKESTGYRFDDIYCSTDLSDSNSNRRKPNPGMVLEALNDYNIDPNLSFMVGDRASDMIAGKRAGLKSNYLVSIYENNTSDADKVFKDLHDLRNYLIDKL